MATVLLFLTFQVHKAVALGLGDAVSNCSSNSPLMFWKKLPWSNGWNSWVLFTRGNGSFGTGLSRKVQSRSQPSPISITNKRSAGMWFLTHSLWELYKDLILSLSWNLSRSSNAPSSTTVRIISRCFAIPFGSSSGLLRNLHCTWKIVSLTDLYQLSASRIVNTNLASGYCTSKRSRNTTVGLYRVVAVECWVAFWLIDTSHTNLLPRQNLRIVNPSWLVCQDAWMLLWIAGDDPHYHQKC